LSRKCKKLEKNCQKVGKKKDKEIIIKRVGEEEEEEEGDL
jgi:hypothetical protein